MYLTTPWDGECKAKKTHCHSLLKWRWVCVIQRAKGFAKNGEENTYRNSDESLQRCLGSAGMLMMIREKVTAEIQRQRQSQWETNPQTERCFPAIPAILTLGRLWNTQCPCSSRAWTTLILPDKVNCMIVMCCYFSSKWMPCPWLFTSSKSFHYWNICGSWISWWILGWWDPLLLRQSFSKAGTKWPWYESASLHTEQNATVENEECSKMYLLSRGKWKREIWKGC